jgi:TPR repeat protein
MFGCARLGLLYETGAGVAEDRKRSASLYKQACDGAVLFGCVHLGLLLESSGPAGAARAASLYKQACDGGATFGCVHLGQLYEWGRGVARDLGQAAALYARACHAGDAFACRLAQQGSAAGRPSN